MIVLTFLFELLIMANLIKQVKVFNTYCLKTVCFEKNKITFFFHNLVK